MRNVAGAQIFPHHANPTVGLRVEKLESMYTFLKDDFTLVLHIPSFKIAQPLELVRNAPGTRV